jgi:hypothetical protein
MRTDQLITRRGVLRGAGVAATGVAVTALGVGSAAADPGGDGSPLGSWLVKVTGPDFPTTMVVATFAAGGVYTAIDLNPPTPYTALGTWARTGGHTFTNTFWQLATNPFSPTKQVAFLVTSNGQVRGDHVSSTFTFVVFNPSDLTTPIPNFTGNGQATGQPI